MAKNPMLMRKADTHYIMLKQGVVEITIGDISAVIEANDDGVEVRLWPMDGTENLSEVPHAIARLDWETVEELKI